MMKRREAITTLFYFSLGTGMLISCSDPFQEVYSLGLTHLDFQKNELKLINLLSRQILPIHQIESLRDHTTLPFVLQSVNDLYSIEDRKIFQEAYKSFNEFCLQRHAQEFNDMEEENQLKIVDDFFKRDKNPLTADSTLDEKITHFFHILKDENIRYLRTSEYLMKKRRLYEMAPGRYNGEAQVDSLIKNIEL